MQRIAGAASWGQRPLQGNRARPWRQARARVEPVATVALAATSLSPSSLEAAPVVPLFGRRILTAALLQALLDQMGGTEASNVRGRYIDTRA